jgi:hypothetical protein
MDLIGMVSAPKGAAYWGVTFVVAVATVFAHRRNAGNRKAVDDALEKASGGKIQLKPASLCSGKTPHLDNCTLLPPERLLCYDANYLAVFAETASKQMTAFGDTALERYLRPTLLWNDVVFATLLGILTCLLLAAVPSFCPGPWVGCAALLAMVMALTYTIVDIAEDWRLTQLLRPGLIPDARAVRFTLYLTRIKMVSLALSVLGGVIFALLNAMPVSAKAPAAKP